MTSSPYHPTVTGGTVDHFSNREATVIGPVFKCETESKEQASQESYLMTLITFCIHLSASFKPSCIGESITLASAPLQACSF